MFFEVDIDQFVKEILLMELLYLSSAIYQSGLFSVKKA